jgi:capsid protein
VITVIDNQSFLDVAVQESGSVFAAFDLALANRKSVTDALAPGDRLVEVASDYSSRDLASYFKGKRQMIATADAVADFEYELPGEFPISF